MAPLRFLRALYCVELGVPARSQGTAAQERGCPTTAAASARFAAKNPALFHASGFAVTPTRSTGLPPNEADPPAARGRQLATMPALESHARPAAAVYGSDTRFPIYSTEFGYSHQPAQ